MAPSASVRDGQDMTTDTVTFTVGVAAHSDLSQAVNGYLTRYEGSPGHTSSDLRLFQTWCAGQNLDAFTARRREFELYVCSLQQVRRYMPSTVSRRAGVVAVFYRTCVIAVPWRGPRRSNCAGRPCRPRHPPLG